MYIHTYMHIHVYVCVYAIELITYFSGALPALHGGHEAGPDILYRVPLR